jgi:hypothetical protein
MITTTDKERVDDLPEDEDEMPQGQDEMIDGEEDSDEVIEIDEDDLTGDDDISVEDDTSDQPDSTEGPSIDSILSMDGIVLSKHTAEGKHSLKYDSIFKGRKDEADEGDDFERMTSSENFEVDKSSYYWVESIDNENYVKDKRVKEKVYEILREHTDLNFLNNRRKPSKNDFNRYYFLLKTHLKQENFTNVELFNELSVYFSDNLFNMFKLLDNKWRNMIIQELQDHIGRNMGSGELVPRNIHKDTEIEFEWLGHSGERLLITGVVTDVDYDTRTYVVDSYESIYDVDFDQVTKILNNQKFKYNLNKLNNIDFL